MGGEDVRHDLSSVGTYSEGDSSSRLLLSSWSVFGIVIVGVF